MRKTRRSLCTLGFVVMVACSGGGKHAASPGSSPPPPASTETTVRPVDTSFTGQNSAAFCSFAKTYSDRFSSLGSASTPAQLRTAVQEGRNAVNQAVTVAPAEIKPDAQVVANAFGALFTELERVNFDTTKVSAASLSPLQAPEFQASTVRFQAYLRTVCGISG